MEDVPFGSINGLVFKGKSQPETIDFPIFQMGLPPFLMGKSTISMASFHSDL